MDPVRTRKRDEAKYQRALIARLALTGWFSKATHGNKFQSGFPDVFAAHPAYGPRWIEMKKPTGSRLRPSQHAAFAAFEARGVGVWILTGGSDDEVARLFRPPNWRTFATQASARPARPPAAQADGPERRLQDAIIATLEADDWYCLSTFGGIFQVGFPDIYACHRDVGPRWIEVKLPRGSRFTAAQKLLFPKFLDHGSGIWVARDATPGPLRALLEGPPNWGPDS